MEESVQTLVETHALEGGQGAYRLTHNPPSLQVPTTVRAVLAARIDRLPPGPRRLLQIAAVIGTEVPAPLLQAIADEPKETLARGLAGLQAAEFIYETQLFPGHAYTFKHALTQEVAYDGLLPGQRRALHARIVTTLEGLAGDRSAEPVERLAHHALRAELWDQAMAYCRQAGEKALAQAARREAVAYFEQALRALSHLPETRATCEQAIDLRLALRSALQPSQDWELTLTYLREAESLAAALDDPYRLARVSGFLSVHFGRMGEYDQAIAAAQRVLTLATTSGEIVLHALANHYLGQAYRDQGDYRRAIDCFGQAVASLDATRRHERFGQDTLPAVNARCFLASCYAELGRFAEGIIVGNEGLQIAKEFGNSADRTAALWRISLVSLYQGELATALPSLEQAMGLCQDTNLPIFFPRTAAALGAVYTLGGRVADAISLLTRAIKQTRDTAADVFCSLSLAETHLLTGDLVAAYTLAERALALAHRHQERGHQTYTLRLLGDIAARHDPPAVEEAEAHYIQALAIAENLGMRPLVAHCHRSLGELYARLGRRDDACAELSTAADLYRAMDMAFWLPQTEAALAQVGHQGV